MGEMSILLITPSDGSASSRGHVQILLQSLGAQDERCEFVLVTRGEYGIPVSGVPDNVILHAVRAARSTSLSAARNLALTHARAEGLLHACTGVAFPDDDCAYPPGALRRALNHMRLGADMVCAVYGPTPGEVDWKRFPSRRQEVDIRLIMRSQSSGTMFFTGDLVAALGGFDERLGLGARFGSAEDCDYMIRALLAGATAVYDPGLLVLHPYKRLRHEQYFAGSTAVLAKHAFGRGRTLGALFRRLAVGLVLLGRRRLHTSTYVAALVAAVHMLPVAGRLTDSSGFRR
jgi:hypothetical protein